MVLSPGGQGNGFKFRICLNISTNWPDFSVLNLFYKIFSSFLEQKSIRRLSILKCDYFLCEEAYYYIIQTHSNIVLKDSF